MAKVKITITGVPEKEPKKHENGNVDLVFIAQQSGSVPKGLEALKDCACLVHVSPKTWENVQGKVQPESKLVVQGEVKSSINKKGVPFLEVVAMDIDPVEKVEKKELMGDGEAKQKAKAAPPKTPGMKLATVKGMAKFIELASITIPEGLESPSSASTKEVVEYVQEHKTFGKPLLLDTSNVLVEGYEWYLAAKELSIEKVPIAYLKPTPQSKKAPDEQVGTPSVPPIFDFPVPQGTEDVLKLACIKIPERLTPPNPEGLKEVVAYVEAHQILDKPLWVKKESYLLLNGYKRYLAAKELNIQKVPITYTKPPESGKPQRRPMATRPTTAPKIPWYKAEDVVQMKVSDILLTEPIHYKAKDISLPRKLSYYVEHPEEQLQPIAVRKLDEKYSLVTGMQRYFLAKILGLEQVPVVLTELSHEAFMQEHGWVDGEGRRRTYAH